MQFENECIVVSSTRDCEGIAIEIGLKASMRALLPSPSTDSTPSPKIVLDISCILSGLHSLAPQSFEHLSTRMVIYEYWICEHVKYMLTSFLSGDISQEHARLSGALA